MIGKKILLTALFIVAFVVLTITATAQRTGVIYANSQHEIVLDKAAWVGKTLLPVGTYTVHSHGSGAKQQVHFAQEMTLTQVHPEYSSVNVYDEVGKVDCNTASLSKATEVTALHFVEDNGVMRIVSADIAGQTHSHIF
jgi:hypothetical protein